MPTAQKPPLWIIAGNTLIPLLILGMQSELQKLGDTQDENDTLVKSKNIPRHEKNLVKSGFEATLAFWVLVIVSLVSLDLFPSKADNLPCHVLQALCLPQAAEQEQISFSQWWCVGFTRIIPHRTWENSHFLPYPLPTLNSPGDDPVCS